MPTQHTTLFFNLIIKPNSVSGKAVCVPGDGIVPGIKVIPVYAVQQFEVLINETKSPCDIGTGEQTDDKLPFGRIG